MLKCLVRYPLLLEAINMTLALILAFSELI